MYYVTDTHSLIWYLTEDKKLGNKALITFKKADEGKAIIIIPTIILAEIIYICEKKKAELKIKQITDKIKNSLNYIPFNLNMEVLEEAINLKNISEIHDKIIVATTLITGATLLTKDNEIIKSKTVKIAW